MKKTQQKPVEKKLKLEVFKTKSKVYLREKPNFDGKIIRTLNKAEKIEVIEIKDDWAKVKEGYILAKILEK